MRQEIVDKVFRSGLDSLSEEEKESLPSQMDFSDDAYKERLKKIFEEHEDFKTRNFDFFYQAQILWDETMSESIDQIFEKLIQMIKWLFLQAVDILPTALAFRRGQHGEMDTVMQLS